MSDRTYVDTESLKAGSIDIDSIAKMATDIRADLLNAIHACANAGGTGQMGEEWKANYHPNEEIGIGFLDLLNATIGTSGIRTAKAAKTFEDALNDANHTAAGSG